MFGLQCLSLAVILGASPAVSPDPASLAIAPAETARAELLIRRLASEVFRERDNASRELRAMGRLALPSLTASSDSADPEVRMRIEWLKERAELEDMEARVATFLADTEGRFSHDLPGWRRFHDVCGDSPSARALFAELVKNPVNHPILLAVKGVPQAAVEELSTLVGGIVFAQPDRPPSGDLARAIATRRGSIVTRVAQPIGNGGIIYRMSTPNLPDVATVLFAECFVSELLIPTPAFNNGLNFNATNFFYQQAGNDALAGTGQFGPAFRTLAIRWMETRETVASLQLAMNVANNRGLPAATICRHAVKLLNDKGGQPYYRAQAVNMLARHNSVENLFAVTNALNDDGLLLRGGNGGINPDVYVKDAALSSAILLTGQKHADYKFDTLPGVDPANFDANKFSYSFFRFNSDGSMSGEEKREAAIRKWQEWERTTFGSVSGVFGFVPIQTVRYPVKVKPANPMP